jgi:hypothetical protein
LTTPVWRCRWVDCTDIAKREDKRWKCDMAATYFPLPAKCEMFLNEKFHSHNNVSFLEVRYCTLLISFRSIISEAQFGSCHNSVSRHPRKNNTETQALISSGNSNPTLCTASPTVYIPFCVVLFCEQIAI